MARIEKSDLPTRIDENGEPVWGEVALPGESRVFDDESLRGITSFDEAFAAVQEEYGEVTDASTALGTGFSVLDTAAKDSLCGVGFLILEMSFNHGDLGEFVSFIAVTEHNQRVIVNDGSTGIFKQLKTWHESTGRKGGLLVSRGLRRSDYPANDERPAGTTYYLNV